MSIYRSPFWNFSIALICGNMLGAAAAVHVLTTRFQKTNLAIENMHEGEITAIQQKWEDAFNVQKQRADACETLRAEMIEHDARAAKTAEMDKWQQDFRDRWYTLVYEPDLKFSPSPNAQALAQIVDVWRPGLGTVLARLQSAPQPGMQLRMVLHGYVRPEQLPPSVHLVYTLAQPAESAVQ